MRSLLWSSGLLIILFLGNCKSKSINESNTQALIIRGKVTAVKDGDTIKVLSNEEEETIRLAHIDCPEKKQPYSNLAKKFVSDYCFGKEVIIKWEGKKDRNGRIIGEVFINGKCLNRELVKNGLAWHFKRYSKSEDYEKLEDEAKLNHVGLWSENNPIAPWDWRKKKRSNS